MSPREISKKYKHQSFRMPPRHPFFIGKNQVTFQHTIFLLLYALCVFLGASVRMVLEKRKRLYAKKWYKKELV
jgi:hypothetical protein